MKRPTRVPASTVVRMNSASNMIAKWYQKAWPPPPKAVAKSCDMPTSTAGRPQERRPAAPPRERTREGGPEARATAAEGGREDLRHPQRQRRGATGAGDQRLLLDR